MVKHIVMWNLKEEYANDQDVIANLKSNLEGLVGKVPGLLDAKVITDPIDTSSRDLALVTTLESEAALVNYATDPSHVAVADTFVRPFVKDRISLDYND